MSDELYVMTAMTCFDTIDTNSIAISSITSATPNKTNKNFDFKFEFEF